MEIEPNLKHAEKVTSEYFKDFFEDMKFYSGTVNGAPAFGFSGIRNGETFQYSDNSNAWYASDKMIYHYLENIKGDLLRAEKQIILEKQQK